MTMEPSAGTPSGLRDELRGDAQSLAGTAKERVHSEVDARKGVAAEQAKSVSSALSAAAGELGQNSPTWLRSAFEQGASTLQQLAETVENKGSRELAQDVQQLARSNPGTFLAGCALAGFAAARVFKAGSSSASSSSSGSYGQSAGSSAADQWTPAMTSTPPSSFGASTGISGATL